MSAYNKMLPSASSEINAFFNDYLLKSNIMRTKGTPNNSGQSLEVVIGFETWAKERSMTNLVSQVSRR